MEAFTDLGTTVTRKSYYPLGLSPVRPNKLWTHPDNIATRAKAPGRQRGSCGSVRRGRGPEGTDITSSVVKVKREDRATPDYHLSSVHTRKPQDRNDSPISD